MPPCKHTLAILTLAGITVVGTGIQTHATEIIPPQSVMEWEKQNYGKVKWGSIGNVSFDAAYLMNYSPFRVEYQGIKDFTDAARKVVVGGKEMGDTEFVQYLIKELNSQQENTNGGTIQVGGFSLFQLKQKIEDNMYEIIKKRDNSSGTQEDTQKFVTGFIKKHYKGDPQKLMMEMAGIYGYATVSDFFDAWKNQAMSPGEKEIAGKLSSILGLKPDGDTNVGDVIETLDEKTKETLAMLSGLSASGVLEKLGDKKIAGPIPPVENSQWWMLLLLLIAGGIFVGKKRKSIMEKFKALVEKEDEDFMKYLGAMKDSRIKTEESIEKEVAWEREKLIQEMRQYENALPATYYRQFAVKTKEYVQEMGKKKEEMKMLVQKQMQEQKDVLAKMVDVYTSKQKGVEKFLREIKEVTIPRVVKIIKKVVGGEELGTRNSKLGTQFAMAKGGGMETRDVVSEEVREYGWKEVYPKEIYQVQTSTWKKIKRLVPREVELEREIPSIVYEKEKREIEYYEDGVVEKEEIVMAEKKEKVEKKIVEDNPTANAAQYRQALKSKNYHIREKKNQESFMNDEIQRLKYKAQSSISHLKFQADREKRIMEGRLSVWNGRGVDNTKHWAKIRYQNFMRQIQWEESRLANNVRNIQDRYQYYYIRPQEEKIKREEERMKRYTAKRTRSVFVEKVTSYPKTIIKKVVEKIRKVKEVMVNIPKVIYKKVKETVTRMVETEELVEEKKYVEMTKDQLIQYATQKTESVPVLEKKTVVFKEKIDKEVTVDIPEVELKKVMKDLPVIQKKKEKYTKEEWGYVKKEIKMERIEKEVWEYRKEKFRKQYEYYILDRFNNLKFLT